MCVQATLSDYDQKSVIFCVPPVSVQQCDAVVANILLSSCTSETCKPAAVNIDSYCFVVVG